jgi:Integrase zinc binding domain
MNSRSFNAAFRNQKPRKIANAQSCVAASRDAMNSIGVYKVDLYIKGQKFTHPVSIINELNNNIIGIDFMHRNKLIYDVNTRQVKFADEKMNTICATKQITILAMTPCLPNRLGDDKDQILWVWLTDYKYPRTALLLPKRYQKEALCEAHNSIFGGHDANLKTYMKISSSYYCPGLFKDVKTHVQTCLTCQQRKRSNIKPTLLQPLPILE